MSLIVPMSNSGDRPKETAKVDRNEVFAHVGPVNLYSNAVRAINEVARDEFVDGEYINAGLRGLRALIDQLLDVGGG